MKSGLYAAGLTGALLFVPTLLGSMWISAYRIPIISWTPFMVAAFMGFLILGAVIETGDPAMRVLGLICGAGVVFGAIFGSMMISLSPELHVRTWQPFIWSAVGGFVILAEAISRWPSQKAVGKKQ